MSRTAKVALGASLVFCGVIIWGVHAVQDWERDRMYAGVLRDDARRKEKMQKRAEELRESENKRHLYESVQRVAQDASTKS